MNDDLVFSLLAGVIVLGFFALAFWGLIALSKTNDYHTCISFGKETNREVRFVNYTFFRWDCLTPAKDGKWISTKGLRDITD